MSGTKLTVSAKLNTAGAGFGCGTWARALRIIDAAHFKGWRVFTEREVIWHKLLIAALNQPPFYTQKITYSATESAGRLIPFATPCVCLDTFSAKVWVPENQKGKIIEIKNQ